MEKLSQTVSSSDAIDVLASAIISMPGGIDALEAAIAAVTAAPTITVAPA